MSFYFTALAWEMVGFKVLLTEEENLVQKSKKEWYENTTLEMAYKWTKKQLV